MARLLSLAWLTMCVCGTYGIQYLFTMPRTMEVGSETYFCLTTSGGLGGPFTESYVIEATLQTSDKDTGDVVATEVFSSTSYTPDWSNCQHVTAPSYAGQFIYAVNVTQKDAAGTLAEPVFESEQEIKVMELEKIRLVQTDKPIYKPGQTVKFRVLTMDHRLMAQTTPYDQITIESPNGMRVKQWDDVPAPTGLVSLEMPLSADPVLGAWVIKVADGSHKFQQAFTVDEYVLPKFEVTVNPPKYLLATSPFITGSVCAKYTYGKPVEGTMKLDICFEPDYKSYYYVARPCTSIIEEVSSADGCHEFQVPADDIYLGHKNYSSWGQLRLNASITEEATGVELFGGSVGPSLSFYPLTLTMEDDSAGYFKPGFPYKGRVVVKNPDGTPAIGELITVTANNYQAQFDYSRNYTTDDDGIVHFVVTEIESDIGNLYLGANAVVYGNDWRYNQMSYYYRTYSPSGYKTLTKWYSPSNSYIYIPDIDGTVECDSELQLDVFYFATPETVTTFHSVVKAGNQVVNTHQQTHMFDGSSPDLTIFDVDPDQLLTKIEKPTLPPLPPLPPMMEPMVAEGDESDDSESEGVEVIEETIEPVDVQPLGVGMAMPKKKRDAETPLMAHFTMEIPVSQDMSPDAKVLLYYIREDMEVVATTISFNIKGCFKNKVTMTFAESTVKPGEATTLYLHAAPSSTCFVGMVDKSINLLGGSNQLTPSQVFDHVRRVARPYSWFGYWSDDAEYCREKLSEGRDEEEEPMYYGWTQPEGVDAIQAFRDVDMWVVTDMTLETRPCSESSPVYYNHALPVPLMGGDVAVSVAVESRTEVVAPPSNDEPGHTVRSYFPETWLWDIVNIGEDGSLDLPTTIPDTITEWVGNSLCTSPSMGVGVTEVIGVTAFQPFFISFTLPYSVVRGEIVPILITVFNYMADCLTMELTLRETEGFEFSGVGGSSRQLCVCGNQAESTKFYIVPTVVGEIDIEAVAVSIPDQGTCKNVIISQEGVGVQDGVQRQLLVEAEGVPEEVVQSFYMCPDGDVMEANVDTTLPDNLVPDSDRTTVSAIGDIMGPTLANLEDLLRMPYGCGEQNMASWSPNIYVLQYLTNTNQLTVQAEQEAERFMSVGYQRQMKYRHTDGSYSAWGEKGGESGTIWLSAFVVKSMAQSSPYITIDRADVMLSINWFISVQEETGCFPQIGQVHGTYMKGGLAEGGNTAGLTAYILIAMLEADIEVEHPAIRLGFQCLDDQPISDTYTLAVMAYAYSLYDLDSPRRVTLMEELETRKHTETPGLAYWSREETEEKPPCGRVWGCYWYRAPSAEVEMTAYALMAYIADGITDAAGPQPIIQWLTKQRNPYGGFSSTQDTVVALQALAKYASLTYTGTSDLNIEFKGHGVEHMFSVTPDTTLLYQTEVLPPGQGGVVITASGSGCALTQVSMKYNVYKEEETGPAFDLKIQVFRSKANRNNCALRTLEVCASYLRSGGVSNMAIVEVKMPTGWAPQRQSLDKLLKDNRIQKFEIDQIFVQIYFDQVERQETCIDFEVEQEIRMNPKPARATVYDYYETQFTVVHEYEIKTTCATKEELPFPEAGDEIDEFSQQRLPIKKLGLMMCPSCPSEVPPDDDLDILTCGSKAIYKTLLSRQGKFPAKIKADIRNKKKQPIDAFVWTMIDEECSCPILNLDKEVRSLVFTEPNNYNAKTETLLLNAGTTVLPYSKPVEKQVRRIAARKKICEKLDRRRRWVQKRQRNNKQIEV